MSVTFSIDAVPTGTFTGDCYDSGVAVEVFRVSADERIDALLAHKSVCAECAAYGIYPVAVMDVEGGEVNIANTNARHLGIILGADFGDDLFGSMEADDFLGYVLPALAQDHAEILPADVSGATGPTIIDGGFDANRYLVPLADLATEAKRLGRRVVWG